MKLLDLWITETLQNTPTPVVEVTLPIVAPPSEERIPVAPRGAANTNNAEREFQALLQRKYLLVDETKRLGELAAQLGLQVQMRRHHLNSGEPVDFTLP